MRCNPFRFLHLPARRAACFNCNGPASPLGEARRVELAEGGFSIVHFCLSCVRRYGVKPSRSVWPYVVVLSEKEVAA